MLDPKIFLIGFNKCGSRSLHGWFVSAGLSSVHYKDGKLARVLTRNKRNGLPPFKGMRERQCYSDFYFSDDDHRILEGGREFAYLHQHHPDAYFILNTRDEENWLRSRFRHHDGLLAQKYQRSLGGVSLEAVEAEWRRLWKTHHEEVRAFFGGSRGVRFCEFDIEAGDPAELAAALRPDFDLDPAAFPHVGVTRGDAIDIRTMGDRTPF